MSTGDEVAGTAAGPSSIRDANRPGLVAIVRKDGATPVDLGVVGDDETELARRLERAVDDCDVVILTGGVSVGDHDHVKHVLAELAERSAGVARWMRLAVRPAKPLMFATIGGVPVLGLPGNPAERVRQLPPVRSPGARPPRRRPVERDTSGVLARRPRVIWPASRTDECTWSR